MILKSREAEACRAEVEDKERADAGAKEPPERRPGWTRLKLERPEASRGRRAPRTQSRRPSVSSKQAR